MSQQDDKLHAFGPTGRRSTDFKPRRATGIPVVHVFAGVCFGIVAVFSLLLIAGGNGAFKGVDPSVSLRASGYVGVILCLTLGPLTLATLRAGSAAGKGGATGLEHSITQLADAVRRLEDTSTLSPDARRVLNRKNERDLLCRAIEEDMQTQAWDAAIVLCNELSERFGYRADAEEYRTRIEIARAEVTERRLSDAIARLDGLIVQRRWDVALQEAARIGRLFPESPRVENLRPRVEQARRIYKEDLERRFLEAARAERIDEAMVLLKELDAYLSENEAEPFREVARGVVSKARENLGAQFKLAAQNRDWKSCVMLGRRIMSEFPNTRMAEEVRAMWDGILTKANAAAAAGVANMPALGEPVGTSKV